MNKSDYTKLSKFLSYVLRHAPQSIGLNMDKAGWVNMTELLEKSASQGLTSEILFRIVAEDTKQRYGISEDGTSIRANQGHSIEVDLGLKEKIPPIPLYHGTPAQSVEIILKQGLKKMNRHHVHLSTEQSKALEVGQRRGKAVLLVVDTRMMVQDGIPFFLSENGVWLTDFVDPKYLSVSTT